MRLSFCSGKRHAMFVFFLNVQENLICQAILSLRHLVALVCSGEFRLYIDFCPGLEQ